MRLEITRRSDLAIRLLRILERTEEPQRAVDLAKRVGSTPQFVPHVMKPLVQAGWVGSEPGPRGGYSLAMPLDSISVLTVIELIEGETDTGACVLSGGTCGGPVQCALHDAWSMARTALLERLDRVPVSTNTTPGGERQ